MSNQASHIATSTAPLAKIDVLAVPKNRNEQVLQAIELYGKTIT